jgi:hypothetical protein
MKTMFDGSLLMPDLDSGTQSTFARVQSCPNNAMHPLRRRTRFPMVRRLRRLGDRRRSDVSGEDYEQVHTEQQLIDIFR